MLKIISAAMIGFLLFRYFHCLHKILYKNSKGKITTTTSKNILICTIIIAAIFNGDIRIIEWQLH